MGSHRPVNIFILFFVNMTEAVSVQLYDYEGDPHETANVAGNASHAHELARLAAQLRVRLEANR